MAELILVRHGQSTWNAANRFKGWVDVPLSHQGREEASAHGNSLRSIMMVLDGLDQKTVCDLEIATSIPIVYDISPSGKVVRKIVLDLNPPQNPHT